jgi:hypothetical protein
MSHLIDFDAIEEKLFVLEQIAHASETYCEREMIGSELDIGDYAFDMYWGWIKGIGSNYLIECAIKTRIFQDYLSENNPEIDLSDIDTQALNNLNIGVIHDGAFALTLRESCNKIIHAIKAYPAWSEQTVGGNLFKYWNGSFHLHGRRGNRNWHLELNVRNWAKAMTLYHRMLSSLEGRVYMGQDL